MTERSLILVNPPLWLGPSRVPYFENMRRMSAPEDLACLPGEHLGLASIQAFCRGRGLDVHVVNGMLEGHLSLDETFAAIQRVARAHGDPVLLGFSGVNLVFDDSRRLVRMCRERWKDVRTIFGYDFATLNYARILEGYDEVDFVCRGDGERTFAVLAEELLAGRERFEQVAGLAWKEAGSVRTSAPVAEDIDLLPLPSREQTRRAQAMGLSISVFNTRGCPYRCTYCATGETASLFGKRAYRERAIERTVDEILHLKRDFDVAHVMIVDDLFVTRAPASRERARAFAELLLRERADVTWSIDCRVDSIDRDLFALLRRAGLRTCYVGVETADEAQLRHYNKRYLLGRDSPTDRLRVLQELGIKVFPGILMFHPAVTKKELAATLELIEAVGFEGTNQFQKTVRAYPGTPLFDEYEKKGWLVRGDWPVKFWEFLDPRVKRLFNAIVPLASKPAPRSEVVTEFRRLLEEWDLSPADLLEQSRFEFVE